VVTDISSLLALTGPTVIAIDQLDGLFARSTGSLLHAGTNEDGDIRATLGQIADGLLNLHDATRRTLTVITCLPEIWVVIRDHTAGPVPDRFRETYTLHRIPSGDIARAIVAKRFDARFRAIGFQPPYPTWPIAPEALDGAVVYTPRRLIKRVEAHITACLNAGTVTELTNLDDAPEHSPRGQRRAARTDRRRPRPATRRCSRSSTSVSRACAPKRTSRVRSTIRRRTRCCPGC
jgi:hypothetical protein